MAFSICLSAELSTTTTVPALSGFARRCSKKQTRSTNMENPPRRIWSTLGHPPKRPGQSRSRTPLRETNCAASGASGSGRGNPIRCLLSLFSTSFAGAVPAVVAGPQDASGVGAGHVFSAPGIRRGTA